MRIAIRLCIKDIQRLWLYIVILTVLFALQVLRDVMLPLHPISFDGYREWLAIATGIMLCIVTALAIQTDRLIGDRQFWLTRPISWRNLLAGKLLFLICMVNVPVLIMQTAAMLANGISPIHHISVLCQGQHSVMLIVAGSAVLASVTGNLQQVATAILTIFFGKLVLDASFISSYFRYYDGGWSGAQDFRSWILFVPLIIVSALLLLLQYSRRATVCARVLCFMAAFLFILTEKLPLQELWHYAEEYRAQASAISVAHPPISIVFLHSQPIVYRPIDHSLVLPVRVSGIPEGDELINERVNFLVKAPDASIWISGWREAGRLSNTDNRRGIDTDGNYDLTLYNIDRKFYERIQAVPVHIRVSMAIALLGPPDKFILQQAKLTPVKNDTNLCGNIYNSGIIYPLCIFSDYPSMHISYQGEDVTVTNWASLTSIWRYRTYRLSGTQKTDSFISVRQEKARFETTLDIPEVRSGDSSGWRNN
jgi:hypothetical protein